jgi:superfamily I DNA/RNA helicase
MTEIVLGPPGTGKTTSLLQIIDEELTRGTPPDRIGYVSYTKRAAEEGVTRACEKFNLQRSDFPWFRTLHSLAFRRLGLSRSEVLEGTRMQEFADYARVRITGRWSDDGTLLGFDVGDRIIFMENLARIRGITLRELYDEDDDRLPWNEVERVSRALQVFKQSRGYLDYTDMLTEFVNQEAPPSLEVLLVDEAQDLSHLQ